MTRPPQVTDGGVRPADPVAQVTVPRNRSTGSTQKVGRGTNAGAAGFGAVAVVLVVLLVVLLVSGEPQKPVVKTASTTTPPTASTTVPQRGPKPGPPVCPLTGTPAPGGKVPMRPALAFKVDNYPTARPWSGIDKADIVFEEPVEGFITRLVRRVPVPGGLAGRADPFGTLGGPGHRGSAQPSDPDPRRVDQPGDQPPGCLEPHKHRPALPAVRGHHDQPARP